MSTHTIPDVETQAILALCHHQDGPFRPGCESCLFRQQAAIEHLVGIVAEFNLSIEDQAAP